jgi:hypothetical protein
MKKNWNRIWFALFFLIIMNGLESHMIHRQTVEPAWIEDNVAPFNELMISWNAARPSRGTYHFYVSVKTGSWSSWLLYASWGHDGQSSFLNTTPEAPVRVYQDALEIMEANMATGFQIRVVCEGDARLDQIYGLHVYTNSDQKKESDSSSDPAPTYLPVKGFSQMTLNHVRRRDLCSPTSTSAVVRYLSKNGEIDPVLFAQNVWDRGFDIFGNWVFNVAQAAAELGPTWSAWVERLSGFDMICQRLQQGTPVIVSVRGPLPGSALPYAKGHLIAVIGYNRDQQKVICMDPGFPTDDQTHVSYDLSDFVEAWNRRGRVAYVFAKNSLN